MLEEGVVVGLHRETGLLHVHLAIPKTLLPSNRNEPSESFFEEGTKVDSSGCVPKLPGWPIPEDRNVQTGQV